MPLPLFSQPDWMDEALCSGLPSEWFFTEKEQDRELELPGLEICPGCPVRPQCLDYALRRAELRFGVWGGATSKEREKLKRGRHVRRLDRLGLVPLIASRNPLA